MKKEDIYKSIPSVKAIDNINIFNGITLSYLF